MIHAYDKIYLEKAQTVLGRMLDFAVYDLKYDVSDFWGMFLSSGIAKRFERGDYSVITGRSGVELAYLVLESSDASTERTKPHYSVDRSEEYWAGWVLAYYQWRTSLRFEEIERYVSIRTIIRLYSPYHEMDIRQFCDKMDELYLAAKPDANLKMFRKRVGLTQNALAELSGVPLRTIQQYEQGQKDINKAQSEALVAMARVLCCNIEELIEKVEKKSLP